MIVKITSIEYTYGGRAKIKATAEKPYEQTNSEFSDELGKLHVGEANLTQDQTERENNIRKVMEKQI